jgi:membrane protease YdiL (CAAX protease family)
MEKTDKPHKQPTIGYGPVAAVVVTVTVYFLAQLIVGLVIGLLVLLPGVDADRLQHLMETSDFAKFLSFLLVNGVMLWFVWRFLRARKVTIKSIGLIRPKISDIWYALAGCASYFFLFIVISVLVQMLIPGLDMNQEQELAFDKSTTGIALLWVFLSLVVMPAVAEEIVMRGFLYTGLRKKLSFVLSAIITSVLFAIAHLQWGSGNALLWVAALDTFVLSVILVYLREKTGSLWSPIFVHAMKNGLAFTLLFILKVQ